MILEPRLDKSNGWIRRGASWDESEPVVGAYVTNEYE